MIQKSIKNEIFILLQKLKMHQRELERVLGVNQTNIRRALIKMEKENLIDKKNVGKSKIYFIKDSLEASIFSRISESYKLLKIIENSEIRKVVSELLKNKKVKLAILFGSYAKNLAHKGSDIDIYIETNNQSIKKEIESINSKISVKIGKFNKNNFLMKEIINNNVIIKGVERYYEIKS
jgi:predicted nucleotidyltransferase